MALFETGKHFPPLEDVERLAKYQMATKFYEGNHHDVYERALELLKDSPAYDQVKKLWIPCNLSDVICKKPSELLLAEPPLIESGKDGDSPEQKAILRLAEENDLRQMVFNLTVGGAIRGDAWLKVFYNIRQDFSELKALNLDIPEVSPEVIMQTVSADKVFPELAKGSTRDFKAVNITTVEYIKYENEEIPILHVERHLPGYVVYESFFMSLETMVSDFHGETIHVFKIGERFKEREIEKTGVNVPLMFHFPYSQTDYKWNGEGAIEKITTLLIAVADRLTSIDFILHKHSDPILQGPMIDSGDGDMVRLAGAYVPLGTEDKDLKYVTYEGHLQDAFEELDLLLSKIFLQAQLPTWLFGSNITKASEKGGGTSHTDSSVLKIRYAPVSALIDRLNSHLTRCLADAFYYGQQLEMYANEEDGVYVDGFVPYEPMYPTIGLSNGIPQNEEQDTELSVLRVQNGLLDRKGAIKKIDRVDDYHAEQTLKEVEADEKRFGMTVDPLTFNGSTPNEEE